MEIENAEEVHQFLVENNDIPGYIFSIPSIMLSLVSSRGLIFLILNSIMTCLVYSVGNQFARKMVLKKKKPKQVRKPDFGYESNPQFESPHYETPPNQRHQVQPAHQQQHIIVSGGAGGGGNNNNGQMRYSDQAQQNIQYRYDNPNFNNEDDRRDYSLPRVAGGQQSHQHQPKQNSQPPPPNPRPIVNHEKPHYTNNNQPDNHSRQSQTSSIDYSRSDGGRSSSADRSYHSVNNNEKRPSNDSSLRDHSTRNPATEKIIKEEEKRNSMNVNPPEELRGQLPWSYTQAREDITGPKRTFVNLKADEELPPVPVPDYTLHFPRVKRQPMTTGNGGEES